MKRLIMIIFIMITILNYAEEALVSANGKMSLAFDIRYDKIVDVKNDIRDKEAFINYIDIVYYVDGKAIPLSETNSKVEYINGTNIIKIDGKIGSEIKFTSHIYTPYEDGKDRFYILNDIETESVGSEKEIKIAYLFKSKYIRSKIEYDEETNSVKENSIYVKGLTNKINVYTIKNSYAKPSSMKKIYREREKPEGEQMLVVSEIGKMGIYEENRDVIAVSFESGVNDNIVVEPAYMLDNEFDNWNYWHRNLELNGVELSESKNILQNISFLRMAQLENGAIISSISGNNVWINTTDMIFAIKALIKSGHIEEAKKGLEFMLRATDGTLMKEEIGEKYLISNYDYNLSSERAVEEVPSGQKVVSYYNIGLFLEVFSDYIDETGDLIFLRDNFLNVAHKIADVLEKKYSVSDNFVMDCYNGEVNYNNRKHYLITQYAVYTGIDSLVKEVNLFAPKEMIKKLNGISSKIKRSVIGVFIIDDMIYDTLESKEEKYRNVVVLNNGFIADGKKNEELLKKYYKKYKEDGGKFNTNISNENMLEISMDLSLTLLKNRIYEDGKEIKDFINRVISENNYIMPEYLKIDGDLKQYGEKGVGIRAVSKYILMSYNGG